MTAGSSPIRVLYADSDPDGADAVVEGLERANAAITVTRAVDVDDARAALAAERFRCIVSRYDLADGNGVELLRTVRERYGGVPFVLLVGGGSERIASDAISAGVTEYLRVEDADDRCGALATKIEAVVDPDESGASPCHADRTSAARVPEPIHELAEQIVDADTEREVSAAAEDTLRDWPSIAHPVVALYDPDTSELVPSTTAGADRFPVGLSQLLDQPDGIGWGAFVNDERSGRLTGGPSRPVVPSDHRFANKYGHSDDYARGPCPITSPLVEFIRLR